MKYIMKIKLKLIKIKGKFYYPERRNQVERLTEKRFDKNIVDAFDVEEVNWCDENGNNKESAKTGKAIDKLSGYEDTKLQPKQVEKLKGKYKELQKENRKLKKEMLKMLNHAWYHLEDENDQE